MDEAENQALQEILRLNGLDTVDWQHIATDRDLDGRRTGHIQKIYLDGRGIDTLPPSIGRFISATDFSFKNNKLTSLPSEIRLLHPLKGYFLIDGNHLCILPREIAEWLDEVSGDWRTKQICFPGR